MGTETGGDLTVGRTDPPHANSYAGTMLTAVLAAATCCLSGFSWAEDHCLHIRHIGSPEPGKVRVLVEPTCPNMRPEPGNGLRLLLPGGPARDPTITHASTITVVILDDSRSYRSRQQAALSVIDKYVESLSSEDRVALIKFGGDAEIVMPLQSAAEFRKRLKAMVPKDVRGSTSLLPALKAGLNLVPKSVSPGLAEIIMFTDAGDELGTVGEEWDKVRDQAVLRGLRISAVVPSLQETLPPKQMMAVVQLRGLAEKTDGWYHNGSSETAPSRLPALRDSVRGWLVIEAKLCGVAGPSSARVEYTPGGMRIAWTKSAGFTPVWAPGSDEPCLPAECAPACAASQSCVNGKCEQRSCAMGAACGPGQHCIGGACIPLTLLERVRDLLRWPRWILGAAGLVLLVVGALVLRRLTRIGLPLPEEAAASPPSPPPEEAAGPPSTEAAAPQAGIQEIALPDAYLVAVGGKLAAGQRWQLSRRRTYVGGSTDPADRIDIVIAVSEVSGRHALIELFPSGAVWITDLGGRNGTFVNDRQIAQDDRAAVQPGDRIRLSQHAVFEVEVVGARRAPGLRPSPARPAAEMSQASKKKTQFDPGNR